MTTALELSSVGPRETVGWIDVCSVGDVLPGTAVAVLLAGHQIALVRSRDGRRFHALSNFDPFSKAFVIARGIVGDRKGILKIASPIFKQSFALETGQCLDDPNVVIPVYSVRIVGERVLIGMKPVLGEER